MREHTCCFIGNRHIFDESKILQELRPAIEGLIKNDVHTFLNGGMGEFDTLCAKTIFQFKQKYPFIKNFLVIPYLHFYNFDRSIFDDVLYPELERVPLRYAIPYRNKYMVEHSGHAICYTLDTTGNAYKMMVFAQKQKLNVISLS